MQSCLAEDFSKVIFTLKIVIITALSVTPVRVAWFREGNNMYFCISVFQDHSEQFQKHMHAKMTSWRQTVHSRPLKFQIFTYGQSECSATKPLSRFLGVYNFLDHKLLCVYLPISNPELRRRDSISQKPQE